MAERLKAASGAIIVSLVVIVPLLTFAPPRFFLFENFYGYEYRGSTASSTTTPPTWSSGRADRPSPGFRAWQDGGDSRHHREVAMPYVGYVEFNVPDHEETAAFYQAVFGWQASEMYPGYLSVQSGDEPGIDTGISKSEDGSTGTVATILVPNLDDAIAAVEEHGGRITVPRFPIPGVGHACYFADINDMTVGMWEADTGAG